LSVKHLQELTNFLLLAAIELNLAENYTKIQQLAIDKEGLNIDNGAPIDSFLIRALTAYKPEK